MFLNSKIRPVRIVCRWLVSNPFSVGVIAFALCRFSVGTMMCSIYPADPSSHIKEWDEGKFRPSSGQKYQNPEASNRFALVGTKYAVDYETWSRGRRGLVVVAQWASCRYL